MWCQLLYRISYRWHLLIFFTYSITVSSVYSKNVTFPKTFKFATASAAYQVEGAWDADGKGENIWDRMARTKPDFIKNSDNGDVACDFYHLYKDDIQLMKNAGFDMHRFSISWSRILPDGDITKINQLGIDHYNDFINELKKNGIEPMVTIYHWDLPQKLQDIGGWMNPLIVDYIEDYADVLFKSFGDRVKWWITINEPTSFMEGYSGDLNAPGLNLDSPANYITGHHVLLAHARIYRLYDSKYRATQQGKVSLTHHSLFYKPKTDSQEDLDATERGWAFGLDWFAHPIYSEEGDYPKLMREIVDKKSKEEGRKKSRLPTFTPEEIKSIKGSFDYFAVNYYTTNICSVGKEPYKNTFMRDMNMDPRPDPSWPTSSAPWLTIVPWGLRGLLNVIKNKYNNPPVFITENGYCDKGELNDTQRIYYFDEHLKELHTALTDDKCNIIGYTQWAFLDDFEWKSGYDAKFGIVHVDFNDPKRKRTPKKSYHYFKDFLKTRTITKSD